MSFTLALNLLWQLEGGKWDDPKGGKTNRGMTQSTWDALGFHTSVMDATDGQIASAYRMLWEQDVRLRDPARMPSSVSAFELMPEPADAVGFQFFVNTGPAAFIEALQGVLGVKVDGVLGPVTWKALAAAGGQGERQSQALSNKILLAQEAHYRSLHSEFETGLLNRIKKVRKWLVNQ